MVRKRNKISNSEGVKRWRNNTKSRMVESMGGKCCVCGYNKCNTALAFHHLDPSKKDFSFGATRANPKNWNAIVDELRKCILVCNNCHSEIHENITDIPINPPKFDERFVDYKQIIQRSKEVISESKMIECPVCGELMGPQHKTCSYVCAGKLHYRVDWDSIDLEYELVNKTYVQVANELGVSDATVHKRAKKLGLK